MSNSLLKRNFSPEIPSVGINMPLLFLSMYTVCITQDAQKNSLFTIAPISNSCIHVYTLNATAKISSLLYIRSIEGNYSERVVNDVS